MTREPPLGSSIVVLARRTFKPGTVMTPRVIAPSFVNSETSVETFIEIRPSVSTSGVKESPTPNGLNSIEMVLLSCAIGIGNSPPARKFAVSPEIAVRVGSASVRTSPFCSRAVMTAFTSALSDLKPALEKMVETTSLPLNGNWRLLRDENEKLPVIKVAPAVPARFEKSTPSCLIMVRSISTTETLSNTCSFDSATSRFMTFSRYFTFDSGDWVTTKRAAMSDARVASDALGTLPVRMTVSLRNSTLILPFGISRFSKFSKGAGSRSTTTSSDRIRLPDWSKKNALACPMPVPIR